MKKFILSVCMLNLLMPATFAAGNYSYTILSPSGNYRKDVNIKTYDFVTPRAEEFTIRSRVKEPELPFTITTSESKSNDLQDESESITQKGDVIIYRSGKRFSWRDTSAMTGAAAAIGTIAALDPYTVKIDGKNYIMLKGNNRDFVKQNILGLNDDYKNLFKSLKECDLNNDGVITGAELKQSKIRLAFFQGKTVYYADKTKDFDVENIKAIPFAKMVSTVPKSQKNVPNSELIKLNKPGVYGNFEIELNNGNTYQGLVEFYSKVTINNMVKGNK